MLVNWTFTRFPLNPFRFSVAHTSTGKSSSAVRGTSTLTISKSGLPSSAPMPTVWIGSFRSRICIANFATSTPLLSTPSVNSTAPESGIPCKSSRASFNACGISVLSPAARVNASFGTRFAVVSNAKNLTLNFAFSFSRRPSSSEKSKSV